LHHLYVILFPNNKRYFGITNAPETRWNQHRLHTKKEQRNYAVYQALRKYRPENCKFKVLQSGTFEEMERLEVIRIARYKTWVPKWGTEFGYNTLPGGGLGRLGMKNSPEHRARVGQANTGNQVWLGRKHTEESKIKQSIAKMGTAHHCVPHSSATRAFIAQKTREQFADPVKRERFCKAQRARWDKVRADKIQESQINGN
jgi:group I intron endonuclease